MSEATPGGEKPLRLLDVPLGGAALVQRTLQAQRTYDIQLENLLIYNETILILLSVACAIYGGIMYLSNVLFEMIMVKNRMMTRDLSVAEIYDIIARITVC